MHLPFFQALAAPRFELLDGNNHGAANAARGVHRLLVDPALVNQPEPALTQEGVGLEVPGRGLELGKRENAQVGHVQDHALLRLQESRRYVASATGTSAGDDAHGRAPGLSGTGCRHGWKTAGLSCCGKQEVSVTEKRELN